MTKVKGKVTYDIVDSVYKDTYVDIISSAGEYMKTFRSYHDALDYVRGYLIYKDIIDGEIDLEKYKVD